MAIKRCAASITCLAAARIRIKNVFKNGLPVYLSFSAGKDSLVLAQLLIDLIQKGEIRAEQLTVQFIDEEAIYPCMENIVRKWRKRFLMVGARFDWFCVEVRHFNCFNSLENDESYICWDKTKEAVWIRRPPEFAIQNHPLLKPRKDTFQDFLPRTCRDGLTLTGVRTAESLQRLGYIASMTNAGNTISKKNQVFPIYDWKDCDVWRYLLENNVDIPEVYLYLWQTGHRKNQLRIAQFFSIDSARSLVKMNEYYPDLLEKIIQREPNAYIAALYWDSEMFGRSSKKRRDLEEGTVAEKDYKQELLTMFSNMGAFFTTPAKKRVADKYRKLFYRISVFACKKDYKDMYEALVKGDPKLRSYRAFFQNVYTRYMEETKAELGVPQRK